MDFLRRHMKSSSRYQPLTDTCSIELTNSEVNKSEKTRPGITSTETASPRTTDLKISIPPKTQRLNTLSGLSLRLFSQICDQLSPVDLKCLSFCNRTFFCRLNDRYHGFPALVGQEKFFMMARLQRDLPDHFACYVCNRLHRYDGSESFGLSGLAHRKTSTLPCDNKTYDLEPELKNGVGMSLRTHRHFEHSRCRLSIHQLTLAMRRFHYPDDVRAGISTQSLSYTQVLRYSVLIIDPYDDKFWAFDRSIITLFSIQGQICLEPLGLHVRMQDIMILRSRQWFNSRFKRGREPLSLYEICCHTTISSKQSDLNDLYYGRNPNLTYNCSQCNTDCVIEVLKFKSRVVFLMTRWINLGPGFDHSDPLWNIRSWKSSRIPSTQSLPRSLMAKSPRICFESVASETFQSLRSRNLSFIKGKQYKKGKPFVRLGRRLWHISYQDPSTKWGNGSLWPWLRVFERSHCSRGTFGPIVLRWEDRDRTKKSTSTLDGWPDLNWKIMHT